MTISYDELAALAGNHAMADTACPLCGPGRRSPANRKRRVLRVWHTERGFASYCCARCGECGWARENQVIAASCSRGVREQTGLRPLAQLAPHRTAHLDNAKRSKVALAIWQSSKPAQGTPVETYLAVARDTSYAARCAALPCRSETSLRRHLAGDGGAGDAGRRRRSAGDPPHLSCPRWVGQGAGRSAEDDARALPRWGCAARRAGRCADGRRRHRDLPRRHAGDRPSSLGGAFDFRPTRSRSAARCARRDRPCRWG